jgi:hypothetical protein
MITKVRRTCRMTHCQRNKVASSKQSSPDESKLDAICDNSYKRVMRLNQEKGELLLLQFSQFKHS